MTQAEAFRRAGLIGIREPAAKAEPTNLVDEDECCAPRLIRALKRLDGDHWTCPKCGCSWSAKTNTEASIRHWSPEIVMEVIRL